MCYSAMIEQNLEKLAMRFNATISTVDFEAFKQLQALNQSKTPEELKKILGLKRKPSSPLFKDAKEDGRIYPGYFAPVIVREQGHNLIKPMRFRVRPQRSTEEIPSKYNVFNARLDSLETRKTWSPLFMKNHGIFPFKSFFEWVERSGKAQLINFFPEDKDLMWAPMVFDKWQSINGEIQFESFALITTDPPSEIMAQGHDRCPIFLKESNIEPWLQVDKLSREKAYEILEQKELVKYNYKFPEN